MISALPGGCELIYPLGMVMGVHAGELRRAPCGLALDTASVLVAGGCGRTFV